LSTTITSNSGIFLVPNVGGEFDVDRALRGLSREARLTRGWRSVRVFISSTFCDMQCERDHLVRVVFPELRQRMAGLNLHLVDIDLRWGVTEEEIEQGRLLDVVLEEVERARPFFVALLGERYGTVPSAIPDTTVLSRPWLSGLAGHSITALEIAHGVLRHPELGRKAYFYFRDPGLIAQVPASQRADYAVEDAASEARVRALKESIRASGRPVMEDYPCRFDEESEKVVGLEAFGARVLEDLWTGIREEFPEQAPAPDPLVLEQGMHDAFAEECSRLFVGRDAELARLTEYVEGADQKHVVVTGEPGCGTSAFLARWAALFFKERPGSYLLSCYVGASPDSADHSRGLRHMCGRLKRDLGLLEEIPGDDGKLPETLGLMLLAGLRVAKNLVVLIDGLDRISSRRSGDVAGRLLDVIPARVRLVAGARRGETADILKRRGAREIFLTPLGEDERVRLVSAFLVEYGRKLSSTQTAALLAHEGTGNPLYLRTALEELRLFGSFKGLSDRIASLARDVPGLFAQVLARLEEDHGRDLVAEVFSLIGASRFGLAEAELLSLLDAGGRGRFPRNLWSRLRRSAGFYLCQRGDLVGFTHSQMAKAVSLSYAPGKELHKRLAAYFRTAPVDRKLDEYPYQLRKAEDWERLSAALGDLDLFEEARARNRDIEWMGYWRNLDGRSEAWRVYREALDARIERNGEDAKAAELATTIGVFLYDSGDLSHVEGFFRQALAIREKTAGPGSVAFARTLSDLGGLYYQQGKFLKAEESYKLSLEIFGSAFEPDRISEAACLNNLAELYRAQGRFPEAGPLYERAGEVLAEILGPNSPEAAKALQNRAKLLFAQGRYEEAEKLFETSGRIIERALGADHPDMATVLSSLAALNQVLGRGPRADELARRSLEIYLRAYGPTHPRVAVALNNAAMCLRESGRLAEAEPLYLRAVEIYERASAAGSPDLGMTLNNLAQLYGAQGRFDEAERALRRALSILQAALGPDHLEVGRCLNNLGALHHARGRPSEAEEEVRSSIEIFERTLGPDHPDLARALNNLGQLYQDLGRYADAERLYERSLDILAGSLGAEHPAFARLLHNLASFYHARGMTAESEKLYQRAIELKEKALGPGHPDVALSLNNLGELLYDVGKLHEAEEVFVRALDIRDKTLPSGHPELVKSLNNLAWVRASAGRPEEAEPFYRRALDIAARTFGDGHPTTQSIRANLEDCRRALRRKQS
jgi:tetratricopeptide (TPR) repeat protein